MGRGFPFPLFGPGGSPFYLPPRPPISNLLSSFSWLSCYWFGPQKENQKIVMIDHHQLPENYADINFSYPKISSTCEIVYFIIEASNNLKLILHHSSPVPTSKLQM